VGTAAVTVSGATATIDPSTTLAYGTDYYVQVDAGAFEDLVGNGFAGISDPTTWNFTTLEIDRFETNGTLATAADVGVGPGAHLDGLTIHEVTDQDWYAFEVLRTGHGDLDVEIGFDSALGDLALEVTNEVGTPLATGMSTLDGLTASVTGLAPGTYYVHVAGVGGATNVYSLSVEPGAGSSTRVFYVNDASTTDDYYTWVSGDDSNDGLDPDTPKATVQSVVVNYDLGPADLVVIDTGTYGGGTVTIAAEDEGAAYAGTPAGSEFSHSGNRFDLVDADFNLIYGLRFVGAGGTGIVIEPSAVDASVHNIVRASIFSGTSTAIHIKGGTDNLVIENTITGPGSYGVRVDSSGSATIEGNTIENRNYGIYQWGRLVSRSAQ
jgi:hypothetical protein